MVRVLGFAVLSFSWLWGFDAAGEQITSTCRITAVDAGNRTVSLIRKTAAGEKSGAARVADNADIQFAGKPVALEAIPSPVDASVVYDTEKRQLTSIKITTAPSRGQRFPRELTGHTGIIRAVAFSPRGNFLASTGEDGTVRLWRIDDDRSDTDPVVLAVGEPAHSVAFDRNGARMAVGSGASVKVFDMAAARPVSIQSFSVAEGYVLGLAFSPDNRWLAAGSAKTGKTYLWDTTQAGSPTVELPHESGDQTWSLVFSPDSVTLAQAIAVNLGGNRTRGETRLWDIGVSAPRRKAVLRGDGKVDRSLAFSPDGHLLLCADYAVDGEPLVRVWDIAEQKVLRTFDGHKTYRQPLASVVISPDGKLAASANIGGHICFWGVTSGKEISMIPPRATPSLQSIALSPDATLLAAAGNAKIVWLWNVPIVAE